MAEGRWLSDAADTPPRPVNTTRAARLLRRWAWWPPLLSAYPAIVFDAGWIFWLTCGFVALAVAAAVWTDN